MQEEKYLQEIKSLIENNEANKIVREIKNNYEDLLTKWNIGKLLVEAQGGEKRAKYGNELINKWSKEFSLNYGSGYDARNLRRMRQFYQTFPIWAPVVPKLSWTHIIQLLPIQNENERNYYINQVILNNLSKRELRKEIKNKSFDRLSYADKNNIKLIDTNNMNNLPLSISDMIKDPIILETNKDINNINEEAVHKLLIELVENRYLELGAGFALVGHEYKITAYDKTYKIDLLFFNYKLNCFVVVEVKNKEVLPKDIGQIEFYTKLIDDGIKEKYNNKTIGIIIVKKKNKLVMDYCTSKDNIYLTTFKIINANDKILI